MAVCVLGCRVGSPALVRRARTAAEAFKVEMSTAGVLGDKDVLVLACGGRRWDGVAEADEIARLLQENGVPAPKILRERESHDTYENAFEAAKILSDKLGSGAPFAGGTPRTSTLESWGVVLVSCTWHLPRARLLFERAGIRVIRTVGAPPPSPGLLRRVWWYGRERVSTWKDLQR